MAATLLTKLKELKEQGPGLHYSGICENIKCSNQNYRDLRKLYRTWPHFSGNLYFPVPNPSYPKDAERAEHIFDAAAEARALWADTPYGKLRFELLDFCIAQLESQLSKC